MSKNPYLEFKHELTKLIDERAKSTEVAEFMLLNDYINILCRKVAGKYSIDSDDLQAEIALKIMEDKLLNVVLQRDVSFSRRIFEFMIMSIARDLSSKPTEELSDSIVEVSDISQSAIDNCSARKQGVIFNKVLENKITELQDYRQSIADAKSIDLTKFSTIIEITVEALADMIAIEYHKLKQSPHRYRQLLLNVFDSYILLYQKWFSKRSYFIMGLITQYGNMNRLYEVAKPRYSYRTFVQNIDNLSIWQIEEIAQNLGLGENDV